MPPFGFVLLTHANPEQIYRLINRLNRLFDSPPIQCHHDFSKCALNRPRIPANVRFVEPHVHTAWGRFSLVEATIRTIKLLYERPDAPKWFVLLSGADYPIKPPDVILRDLEANAIDAHICLSLLESGSLKNAWERKCFQRYTSSRFRVPSLDRHLRFRMRDVFLRIPFLSARTLPYTSRLRPFSGGQWFCGNSRAASSILKFHGTNPAFEDHYRARFFPEESYFHTILGNDPQLRVNSDHWRYVDFSEGKANPKTLSTADLPQLFASHAHFARKFDLETEPTVLDELDRYLKIES